MSEQAGENSAPRMIIDILTLFPEGIRTVLDESILARAQRFGIVEFSYVILQLTSIILSTINRLVVVREWF
jgi:hypothetical protein